MLILSPSEPVYYELIPNLKIVPRNVYQSNQKSNVNILSPSEPVYYKLLPNLIIMPGDVYQGNQRAMYVP